MICAKLKYVNQFRETFWFVELGDHWPHKPQFRLIGRTSPNEEDAFCFSNAEDAAATLVLCDSPTDWEIVLKEYTYEPKPTIAKIVKAHKKPSNPGHK